MFTSVILVSARIWVPVLAREPATGCTELPLKTIISFYIEFIQVNSSFPKRNLQVALEKIKHFYFFYSSIYYV